MRKNLGVQPALFPMPVVIVAAYDAEGTVCAMNAAWAQICAMDKIALFIDEDHKTTQNILKSKAFTVSLADKAHMDVADFFGIATGNTMPDKFERTGYTAVKSEFVNAPVIEEYPLTFECKVEKLIPEGEDFHVVGTIENILADESILTNGKPDPKKLRPISLDAVNGDYLVVEESVGKAWREGRVFIKK